MPPTQEQMDLPGRTDHESLAIRKAMALLGGILQRAAESKRIDFNPQRVVRKARLPRGIEVRPLAPAQVEALRAELSHRDATIVSTLAFAGLRPGELRGLRWRHVGDRTLLVDAEKTGTRRSVRLLAPLRDDLGEWCEASDECAHSPALTPYSFRRLYASLQYALGDDPIYVAERMGHADGGGLSMRTYASAVKRRDRLPGATLREFDRALQWALTGTSAPGSADEAASLPSPPPLRNGSVRP